LKHTCLVPKIPTLHAVVARISDVQLSEVVDVDSYGEVKLIIVVALLLCALADNDLALGGTIPPQHYTMVLRIRYPDVATDVDKDALRI
jgi:hypothetical protein